MEPVPVPVGTGPKILVPVPVRPVPKFWELSAYLLAMNWSQNNWIREPHSRNRLEPVPERGTWSLFLFFVFFSPIFKSPNLTYFNKQLSSNHRLGRAGDAVTGTPARVSVDCGGLEAGGREGCSHRVRETGEADRRQRRSVIAKYHSFRVSFHKFLI